MKKYFLLVFFLSLFYWKVFALDSTETLSGEINNVNETSSSQKISTENKDIIISKWVWLKITWDLSTTSLVLQHPNEASFKNNNPTWLTWGISQNLKSLFTKAWLAYIQWTPRPKSEWGKDEYWERTIPTFYIKFSTIEEWLKAYQIAFTQAWTEDIYSRLLQWKSWNLYAIDTDTTSYASSILENSCLSIWDKFSDLNDSQKNNLFLAHLQRESPALYTILTSETKNYYENVVLSSDTNVNKYYKTKNIIDTFFSDYIDKISTPTLNTTSSDWKKIQDFLKIIWYFNWWVNWNFDTNSKNSLISYQVKKNIIENENDEAAWIFWPKTKSALKKDFWKIVDRMLQNKYNVTLK